MNSVLLAVGCLPSNSRMTSSKFRLCLLMAQKAHEDSRPTSLRTEFCEVLGSVLDGRLFAVYGRQVPTQAVSEPVCTSVNTLLRAASLSPLPARAVRYSLAKLASKPFSRLWKMGPVLYLRAEFSGASFEPAGAVLPDQGKPVQGPVNCAMGKEIVIGSRPLQSDRPPHENNS